MLAGEISSEEQYITYEIIWLDITLRYQIKRLWWPDSYSLDNLIITFFYLIHIEWIFKDSITNLGSNLFLLFKVFIIFLSKFYHLPLQVFYLVF